MKPLLTALWQRRWCRLLGIVLIAFALAMLHPFIRQSIFGPQIEGIPWCVWEDEARRRANPVNRQGWFYETLEKIGLLSREHGGLSLDSPKALPVYLHLAEDGDVRVRKEALAHFCGRQWPPDREAEILATLRRHLEDDDPYCRAFAVDAVWTHTKDADLRHILVPLLDNTDASLRMFAVGTLSNMAPHVPETFEPLAKLAEGPDSYNRASAMFNMHYFGKRALPILRKGLGDPDARVRRFAVIAVGRIGKDAAEFVPALLMLKIDPNQDVRAAAAGALSAIDPVRYPPTAK